LLERAETYGARARTLVQIIRAAAHNTAVTAMDDDPLLERIGDARFVLLGAAPDGRHDF